MVKDKYDNKMCLGSNEYSVEVLTLCNLLEWMNIDYQLNKHATTIHDDTGTTRLISVPHSEPTAISRVRLYD